MASFTLDDIRAAAEAKYGNCDITLDDGFEVTLRNPLRLDKKERAELVRLQGMLKSDEESSESEDDQEQVLRDSLKVVAASKTAGNKLNAALDDLTMVAAVFAKYTEATQAGEA